MIAALVYTKLSPYHVPRLEAAGALGREYGHELIGIEVADTQSDYRWPETPQPGNTYRRITLFPGRDYWTLSYASIHRALHRILDGLRPDVVVLPGWGLREALAGLSWCVLRRVPRVVISDSQRTDRPQRWPKLWAKRFLVRRFQAGFIGGRPQVRYVTELGLPTDRCFVGCDVVDNEFFSIGSAQPGPAPRGPSWPAALLSCVRLLPMKNVLGVLDVLAGRDGWSWTIAGDGPQRPEIEGRIRALGLGTRVRLLGHVDYFQLPGVYARADAYLQPSLSDSWGLAVNEAMACALPVVVSSRCGCHEDLVRDGVNGFVFDAGRPGSLAAVLDRLAAARDHWRDMGRASRDIIAGWGLDLFARQFWAACDTAVQSHAKVSGPQPQSADRVAWPLR